MNSPTLKDLQEAILEVLLEIKRVCDENKIKYILVGGSAIGAVRHQGFIPWDDDADIAILREDYNKFKNICLNGALKDKYVLQDIETEPHYFEGFLRIRKKDTKCVIDYHLKSGFKELGVFVDVFPLDLSYTNNERQLNRQRNKISRITRIIGNKTSLKHETIKSKLLFVFTKHIKLEKLLIKRKKAQNGLNKKVPKYIVMYDSKYSMARAAWPINCVEDTIEMDFENHKLMMPKDYDSYLKPTFGNYMQLPPENQRIAHLPKIIEL